MTDEELIKTALADEYRRAFSGCRVDDTVSQLRQAAKLMNDAGIPKGWPVALEAAAWDLERLSFIGKEADRRTKAEARAVRGGPEHDLSKQFFHGGVIESEKQKVRADRERSFVGGVIDGLQESAERMRRDAENEAAITALKAREQHRKAIKEAERKIMENQREALDSLESYKVKWAREWGGWPNGCDSTIPEALRFLANHKRPIGGQERFNAEHLYQLAGEMESAVKEVNLTITVQHLHDKVLTEAKTKERQRIVARFERAMNGVCGNYPTEAQFLASQYRAVNKVLNDLKDEG